METQTLHFRVGADMGRTLQQIAYEHLIYGNDLEKALRTLNLGEGCDEEMQYALLKGEKIILVDEEDQQFIVVDRADYPWLDKIYPKLDVQEYGEKLQSELNEKADDFIQALKRLSSHFAAKTEDGWGIKFSVDSVLKFIYGNDEDMIEELKMDWELDQWRMTIRFAKEFVDAGLKKAEIFRIFAGRDGNQRQINTLRLLQVADALERIARGEFSARYVNVGGTDIPDIGNYIKAVQDIDEKIEAGLEPVDIMKNYSAGWLSPEGEYYALNGEIANMLHNQIADALQEKGLIPMYANEEEEKLDIKLNADLWLEEQGWVKIHGNHVQMGSDKALRMTKEQKDMITKYITDCHQCTIKLGWQMKMYSIGMFRAMDVMALHKHFWF